MTVTYLNNDDNAMMGSLLVEASLVTSDMVEIALQISAGFGESLGQVLVDTNRITESDLQNAVRAQAMVKTGLVDMQVAARALHFSHKTRLAFGDAVNSLFGSGTVELAQAA